MKDYKGYLFDLDGTLYKGDKVIESAVPFFNDLKEQGKEVLCITNNASRSVRELTEKLKNMGFNIEESEILTSADVMVKFLKNQGDIAAYLIGSSSFAALLRENNVKFETRINPFEEIEKIKNSNCVVIGYDNELTYKDLAAATLVLQRQESKLYATNTDFLIPREIGLVPGNGSIVSLLEKTGGKEATVVGKPFAPIVEEALRRLGLEARDVCLIGDNYETDILTGINNNIDTIMVETGVSMREDVYGRLDKPTYIVSDLSETQNI